MQLSSIYTKPSSISLTPRPVAHQDIQGDLQTVFDVGMNNGDDSAYYLSRGCRVIAIEANPLLAELARERFRTEIASGRMVLEAVGIVDRPGKIPFWINEERTVFSSFDRAKAGRDGMKCHPIEVTCVTFDMLLKRYGVPDYLKLDVEGAEPHCLRSLEGFGLPAYISVEAESLEYLLLLWNLGYRQFKIVDQMRHNSWFPDFTNENILSRLAKRGCQYVDRFRNRVTNVSFPRGSSGPFAPDVTGGWQTKEEVAYNWLHLHFGYHNRGTLSSNSWYDFHAKAPSVLPGIDRPKCLSDGIEMATECFNRSFDS
jgi:FkbM family methyltransferase